MKDMKKVAEFGTSYLSVFAGVAARPLRLAHLPGWPKAKSLHVLHALHGEYSFFLYLHEPLNW